MNKEKIISELFKLQDIKYKNFQSSLIPGAHNVIGVRMPKLRSLAANMLKSDGWQNYLAHSLLQKPDYYEEAILTALLIGTAKISCQERLRYARLFIPHIDNWAVCDTFCSALKEARLQQKNYWDFIQPYLLSSNPYELRFAIVILLNYFTGDAYAPQALRLIAHIQNDDYYVQMAQAWAISIFFIKQCCLTVKLLEEKRLPPFTQNKAIQKIRESYRVAPEDKQLVLEFKLKP